MKHRISAGAFVLDQDRILLVRHKKEGSYDFWVAPGGGVIGTESLLQAAKREVKEETGIDVEPLRPVCMEEFYDPKTRHIKTWVLCKLEGGCLSVEADEAVQEHIVEARFFSEEEIKKERMDVYPAFIRTKIWEDLAFSQQNIEHIGIHEAKYF
ncbi:hydrolase, NUDIX family, putative [Verrucomicrobiia bacterium DG1235]|nr:hydrolase, NUDIX family, putative [Verrucomicrobiae bacterium DG1235]